MKVSVLNLDKKEEFYSPKENIIFNGEDNLYPELIDRLKNNSVTAKMSSLKMVQYLLGDGFGDELDFTVINTQYGTMLYQFAEELAQDLVDYRGFFVHISYDVVQDGGKLTAKPKNPKLIPFAWCRLGKADDTKYSGKILVKTSWADTSLEASVYDVYNKDQNVTLSQIEASGGANNYKGQIMYYNCDAKYYYPLARIDAVKYDCESESKAGIYKNNLLNDGFFGKTIIATRPLVDTSIQEYLTGEDGENIINPEYLNAESEGDETREEIKGFLGADQAGGVLHIEMDNAGDKLEDSIYVKQIESEIEADMFLNIEDSLRSNILIAHNNIPIGLVVSSESLFSASGEAYKEMQKEYWNSTKRERKLLKMQINYLLEIIGIDIQVEAIPFIEEEVNKEDSNENKEDGTQHIDNL